MATLGYLLSQPEYPPVNSSNRTRWNFTSYFQPVVWRSYNNYNRRGFRRHYWANTTRTHTNSFRRILVDQWTTTHSWLVSFLFHHPNDDRSSCSCCCLFRFTPCHSRIPRGITDWTSISVICKSLAYFISSEIAYGIGINIASSSDGD